LGALGEQGFGHVDGARGNCRYRRFASALAAMLPKHEIPSILRTNHRRHMLQLRQSSDGLQQENRLAADRLPWNRNCDRRSQVVRRLVVFAVRKDYLRFGHLREPSLCLLNLKLAPYHLPIPPPSLKPCVAIGAPIRLPIVESSSLSTSASSSAA